MWVGCVDQGPILTFHSPSHCRLCPRVRDRGRGRVRGRGRGRGRGKVRGRGRG